MKRILSRMVVLALCLCLTAASAGAASISLLPDAADTSGARYRQIIDAVTVGDTLYLLTIERLDAQLYRWQKGMPEAELLADGLVYSKRYSTEADLLDVGGADPTHALSSIFTDGEVLFGYNSVTNLVFEIADTEAGIQYIDVTTLPMDRVPVAYRNPYLVHQIGKWLLWHESYSGSRSYGERLLVFNLENGSVKIAALTDAVKIVPYRDGLALVIGSDRKVYTYNPETDEQSLLGVMPSERSMRSFAYSEELDMLIYMNNTRLMGWNPKMGAEQLGFVPGSSLRRLTVMEDQAIYSQGTGIAACEMVRGYAPAHSVLALNGNVDAVAEAFCAKYPEVPYYYETNVMGNEEKLLTREQNAPDMICLAPREGKYDELIAQGLLMDLSVYPEIKAYVDALYPAYKELAMEDDAIYGVPVRTEAYNGWFINKEVMNAMGLTAEDIPTSLTELCAFATKWNNEWAEKYPNFMLLNNTSSYRQRLLEAILDSWRDYCRYVGKELTYDDPIFREALSALDAASLNKLDAALQKTDPEVSEYTQALIWTGCKTVGNWQTYMEDFSDRIFIPLTLTPETPYVCAVANVGVWAVNASSDNGEYAAAMLAEIIAGLDDAQAYALRADKTEPVMSDNGEQALAEAKAYLASLEARREETVNKEALEKRIEEQETYIEDKVVSILYRIVPSALENYIHVLAPATVIHMNSGMSDEERQQREEAIRRYVDGEDKAEDFITRMNELIAK